MNADEQKAATERNKLTTGPIAATLFFFALPVLFGNVLQSLNGSVNSIWVGQFLGENALALALWVIRIPLAYYLANHYGLDALWWSIPASFSTAVVITFFYYFLGNWKKARMITSKTAH